MKSLTPFVSELAEIYERAAREHIKSILLKEGHRRQLPARGNTDREVEDNLHLFAWGARRAKVSVAPTGRARKLIFAPGARDAIAEHPDPRDHLSTLLKHLERGAPELNDRNRGFLPRHAGSPFHFRKNRLFTNDAGRPFVFRDHMLADWRIHHFHADQNHGPALLFVVFREDDALIVDLKSTHAGVDGISFNHDPDILRSAALGFPNHFCRLNGITGSNYKPSEIQVLRSKNVGYVIETPAGCIAPDFPVAANGQPLWVTRGIDMTIAQFDDVEAEFGVAGSRRAFLEGQLGGPPGAIDITLGFDRKSVLRPVQVNFRRGNRKVNVELGRTW